MSAILFSLLAAPSVADPPPPARAGRVRFEITVQIWAVPIRSEAWERISEVQNVLPMLEEAIASGAATRVNEPRVALRNGRRGETEFTTGVTYFRFDETRQEYEPATVTLRNSLVATPRLLNDGTIEVPIECRQMRVLGVSTGPHNEAVPTVVSQSVEATIFARDGETVAIEALAAMGEEPRADEGDLRPVASAIYLLVTPRIINPHVLAPEPRERYRLDQCIDSIEGLCGAARLYADDTQGMLPGAEWEGQVDPYHGSCVPCPVVGPGDYGFVLNAKVAGLPLDDITDPAGIVLFFEGDTRGLPPVGGIEAAPLDPRHEGKIVVGFVDGNAHAVLPDMLQELLDRDPLTYVP